MKYSSGQLDSAHGKNDRNNGLLINVKGKNNEKRN
jgi:hypothetical protein